MSAGVTEGDDDLSFDLLFSGPLGVENNEKPSSLEIHEQDRSLDVGRNYQDCEEDTKDDGESIAESPVSLPPLSASAPQSNSSASARRRTRTRSRKRSTTTRNEKETIVEKEKLSVFVYGCNRKKINFKEVLDVVDEKVGQPREYYHKEGQGFGFIQFQTTEATAKAAEALNNIELGDTVIGAECCSRSSARDAAESPLVKNSILVIKNLPYNMKEEKLLHILHAFEDQTPEDVSFHHDSSGTFRGMAFVKYFSVQDASFVFDHINSIDVGGRPIKVEYKRKPDPADEDHQKIQQQLQHFKESDGISDLAFPFSLSNSQRKQIHVIAEKLGLRYQSFGENENRYIVVSKKKEEESGKSANIPKRKTSNSGNLGSSWSEKGSFGSQKYGSSWSAGSSYESSSYARSRSMSGKAAKSPSKRPEASPAPAAPVFAPRRDPKGPDGTQGFSSQYRISRQRKK